MPGDLGERIKKAFNERYPGNIIGVGPRILFSYKYLEAECKNAAFQKTLRNLDIPGDYDVVSVHPEEDDSDAIYSVSEGIDDTEQIGGGIVETIYMLQEGSNKYLLGEAY